MRRVAKPKEGTFTEGDSYCRVTSWDGVCNNSSNLVEAYIVDAKSPHELANVLNMLLMGLGRKQCLKKPFSNWFVILAVQLAYVANLIELRDTVPHNWYFSRAIINLFYGDGFCRACINLKLIIFNRDELALWGKD